MTLEYHQFDYWIGAWDVFDVDNPSTTVARGRVDHILDGCVLREDYQGTVGKVFVSRKVWHQSWVTNRGRLLVIEGQMQAGKMVLPGVDRTTNGTQRQVRGTWQLISGSARETAVTSTDGGKTWKQWFDLLFLPRVSSSDRDDGKIIAELDRQYQAAVQQNDAATMGRISADDFVLVTGSGKTYIRAELLEQAPSGQVRHEHQDDTDQTVRDWGDTAGYRQVVVEGDGQRRAFRLHSLVQ